MVMVPERQSGNHSDSPLQYLQFPTMTGPPVTKLKIKITSKKVESCDFGQREFKNVESGRTISMNGNKNSVMNKFSYDDPKLYSADNLKLKLSMGSSNKRGFPGGVDYHRDKRQKLDRAVKQQCGTLLRTLMLHPAGWVFNKPVDPVALNIPDYFSIIAQPMDLGTIKSNLDNNVYFSVAEFASDVRLTFSNAVLYNPPSNQVHGMAKELDDIFTRRWKMLEAKWNRDAKNAEQGCKSTNILEKLSPARISLLPKNSMPSFEKKKLIIELLEASRGKMTEKLRSFLQKLGLIYQKEEELEARMDALDNETLSALKRLVKASLDARAPKAQEVPFKMSETSKALSLGKVSVKGSDCGDRSKCGSANTKSSSSLAASKCGSCSKLTCQCNHRNDYALASTSDLSSERSLGHGREASKRDREVKSILKSCSSKASLDPNSVERSLGLDRDASKRVNLGLDCDAAKRDREVKPIQKSCSSKSDTNSMDLSSERSLGLACGASKRDREVKPVLKSCSSKSDTNFIDLSSERSLGLDRGATRRDREVKTVLKFSSSKSVPNSMDLSSQRSLGLDPGASKRDMEVKTVLKFSSSKSDLNSSGVASTLDEENFCSTPQPSTRTTTVSPGEAWTPLVDDLPLSPNRALRAARLKSRFADTIFKAKQKTHLNQGDRTDPVKMQQEKERMERQQREEKARIEAQIKVAEHAARLRAESELKMQREREREAARIALQKMEKTVQIDENFGILKDLEILRASSESGSEASSGRYGSPLERLGLFIKSAYAIGYEEDDDYMEMEINIPKGGGEEGEICA